MELGGFSCGNPSLPVGELHPTPLHIYGSKQRDAPAKREMPSIQSTALSHLPRRSDVHSSCLRTTLRSNLGFQWPPPQAQTEIENWHPTHCGVYVVPVRAPSPTPQRSAREFCQNVFFGVRNPFDVVECQNHGNQGRGGKAGGRARPVKVRLAEIQRSATVLGQILNGECFLQGEFLYAQMIPANLLSNRNSCINVVESMSAVHKTNCIASGTAAPTQTHCSRIPLSPLLPSLPPPPTHHPRVPLSPLRT